jgi:hypothetical protein
MGDQPACADPALWVRLTNAIAARVGNGQMSDGEVQDAWATAMACDPDTLGPCPPRPRPPSPGSAEGAIEGAQPAPAPSPSQMIPTLRLVVLRRETSAGR